MSSNNQIKRKLAFAIIMGAITTGIITFTLVGIQLGYNGGFLKSWLHTWFIAYTVSIPVIFFIGPIVQKLADRIL